MAIILGDFFNCRRLEMDKLKLIKKLHEFPNSLFIDENYERIWYLKYFASYINQVSTSVHWMPTLRVAGVNVSITFKEIGVGSMWGIL